MLSKNKTKKQFMLFLIVGISTVIIDYTFYNLILYLNYTENVSKLISFLVGTIYAYQANRIWTFSYKTNNFNTGILFFSLYIFSLYINVIANSYAIKTITLSYESKIKFAFIFATMISAAINFLGMKYIVFKNK
tara:strand:+ start:2644 stop:3045 length:402 start_codon:yes stop_codon:yes gene_type:complete